jgi:hypothetical protein
VTVEAFAGASVICTVATVAAAKLTPSDTEPNNEDTKHLTVNFCKSAEIFGGNSLYCMAAA